MEKRGAQAALVTLWKISDQHTPRFMRGFYRLLADGRNKAEALRSMQRAYIEGGAIDGDPVPRAVRHPYYWAPFILMGN